jgi:hypothetical protein
MAMDVEAEIRDLKRRVGELEGSYSFLSGQLRDVHRSVLGFQAQTNERFDGVDGRFDGVDGRLDRVESDLGIVKSDVAMLKDDVRRLREDLPSIVGGAVREALR